MMTDPIADMLTRLRNANKANFEKVDIPASRVKANICKVLKQEGYIQGFKLVKRKQGGGLDIRVSLRDGSLVGLQRVSKPGLRVYKKHDEMPRVISGLGISIVSTSKGVISSRDARVKKVGGEVLCNVW